MNSTIERGKTVIRHTLTVTTGSDGTAATNIPDSIPIVHIDSGAGLCMTVRYQGKWIFIPLSIENGFVKTYPNHQIAVTYDTYE